MEITFEILKAACEFNGSQWKDSDNCNHSIFCYSGELEGYGDDSGYIIRSDQPCQKKICPFLKGGQ